MGAWPSNLYSPDTEGSSATAARAHAAAATTASSTATGGRIEAGGFIAVFRLLSAIAGAGAPLEAPAAGVGVLVGARTRKACQVGYC